MPAQPPRRRIRKADLPRDELGRLRAPGQPDEMAHLKGLGARIEDPDEAYARGAALFDEERFFEAYVHLALAWKQTRAAAYRGLAQVAAGLCHVQRGNPDGAQAVLERGREGLAAAVPPGLASEELRRRVDAFLAALDRGGAAPFPRLPWAADGSEATGGRR